MTGQIKLLRDCEATQIPSGTSELLLAGTGVLIQQSSGDGCTIAAENGLMYRIDAKDADALGLQQQASTMEDRPFSEEAVWEQLRSVYDPEIPVNIVDLGLIYSCAITKDAQGAHVDVKMSLTAPGCGMAEVLKCDVERRICSLSGVAEVKVEVVFDPPWNPGRMSEEAKLQLGFDLDYGTGNSGLPIIKS
jgi:probable FeS assembly SUF system protein SufT